MNRRKTITDLVVALNALSFDDERRLDQFLGEVNRTIRIFFGDFNAYQTCLECIRFYPPSPLSSPEENVRFWAHAKKELRDLLHVMLDDPALEPTEQVTNRVSAHLAKSPETLHIPDTEHLVGELTGRVREDRQLAEAISAANSLEKSSTAKDHAAAEIDGPRSIERVRIDLRDLFILERNPSPAEWEKPFLYPDPSRKIFFLPGPHASTTESVRDFLRQSGAVLLEGEHVTSAGPSIQEQLLRDAQITTAVVVFSDEGTFIPRQGSRDEDALRGPSSSSSFSLGFLVGRLGRKNVMAIYNDGPRFRRPTHYFDVIYVAFDQSGFWRKELKDFLVDHMISRPRK